MDKQEESKSNSGHTTSIVEQDQTPEYSGMWKGKMIHLDTSKAFVEGLTERGFLPRPSKEPIRNNHLLNVSELPPGSPLIPLPNTDFDNAILGGLIDKS